MQIRKFAVDGMHCRSCELTIERRFKRLPNVRQVDVNVAKGVARVVCEGEAPTLETLNRAVAGDGYHVRPLSEGARPNPEIDLSESRRPSFWQLVGLFALVLLLGKIVSGLGWLKPVAAFNDGATFWTVFAIGLVAASSACIAVSGGLLLSAAATFNARYRSAAPGARMRPVFLFVAGRVASYGLLGGTIGLIGKALTPSPLVTGSIAILAALYMLVMGLDMLRLAPAWLKGLMPRMPKSLSHRIMDAEGREHPLAPLLLGAATFFLPCGFTQALQLYALTTGSFARSALLMSGFALGTAPALLALGWASGSLRGKAGSFFFRFSGALVVVLGLWNVQNGLAITGHPLTWPSLPQATAASGAKAADPDVTFDGTTQVMRMSVSSAGYAPDRFTIKAGVPTRWDIDGTHAAGCISVLQVPGLGIRKDLALGPNAIEFTAPSQPGSYPFSCSMGMYRGVIDVVAS